MRFAALLLLAACSGKHDEPAPKPAQGSDARVASTEVTGTLTSNGAKAVLTGCRPQHADHVFVDVDTSEGTLRFASGALSWNGAAQQCNRLERSWGGGVRADGSAYFRGTIAFSCGNLFGDLTLDCGNITAAERAELDKNRDAARAGSGT